MKGIKFLVVVFLLVIGSTGFTKASLHLEDRDGFAYNLKIKGDLMEIDTRKTKTENGKSYYFASDGTPLTVNGEILDLKSRADHVLLSPSGKGNAPKKIEASSTDTAVAKKKGLFDYEKTAPLADPREGKEPVDQSAPSFTTIDGKKLTFDEVSKTTKKNESDLVTLDKDTYSSGLSYEGFSKELASKKPGKDFSSAVVLMLYDRYKQAAGIK